MSARVPSITFVSTPLPPAICGIGTHTAMLSRFWPGGGRVTNLVYDGAEESQKLYSGHDIVGFEHNAKALYDALQAVPAQQVFVQYAGRGFSKLGVPLWFLSGLKRWRKQNPNKVLLVYMHELWGDVKITHKRYLLEKCNRWIILQLMKIADVIATNTENHRERLQRLLPGREVCVAPVGTNIVADAPPTDFAERKQGDFVLFGRAYGRIQTLKMLSELLPAWQAAGKLRALHLIGPKEDRWEADEAAALKTLAPEVVKRHGSLPEAEVSRLLAESGFALMAQTPDSVMKSTTFMAYASHRCAIVTPYAGAMKEQPWCWMVHQDEILGAPDLPKLMEERIAGMDKWYEANAAWPQLTGKLADAMSGASAAQH